MLRDWLAATFLGTVVLLVLRHVSVAAVGSALVLPAVGFALLPAVGFAPLGAFHHRSRSSCSSRCPRTLVASLFLLTTCSLAEVPSVILSHHWLFGCGSFCAAFQSNFVAGYDSVARFWLPSNITTQHCALRD